MIQTGISGTLGCNNDQTIFCIRGNAVDRDTTANGGFAKKDISYTLNTVDRHAVCAGFAGRPGAKSGSVGYAVEQAPTLLSSRNDASVLCLNDQGGSIMNVSHDVSGTLRAQEHGHQPTILDMTHACDVIRDCGGIAPNLQARMGTGGNQVPLVFRQRGFGDYQPDEVGSTCKQRDSKDATDLVVTAVDCRNGTEDPDTNGTLQAKESYTRMQIPHGIRLWGTALPFRHGSTFQANCLFAVQEIGQWPVCLMGSAAFLSFGKPSTGRDHACGHRKSKSFQWPSRKSNFPSIFEFLLIRRMFK